jgi:hypothetical protein
MRIAASAWQRGAGNAVMAARICIDLLSILSFEHAEAVDNS